MASTRHCLSSALRCALAAAVCGACTGAPAERLAAPGELRLELDVVVDADEVTVFPRRLDRDCSCSTRFVHEEGCDNTFSDAISCRCDGGPVTTAEAFGCLDSIELVGEDGEPRELLMEDTPDGETHEGYASGLRSPTATLALYGCGDFAALSLDVPLVALPEDLSALPLRLVDDAPVVAIDLPAAVSVQITAYTGFIGRTCHSDSATVARVPETCASFGFGVAALSGPRVVVSDGGTMLARVWGRTAARIDGAGLGRASGTVGAVQVTSLDRCGEPRVRVREPFSLESEPRLTLADGVAIIGGETANVRFGPDADVVTVVRPDDSRAFRATIAHEPRAPIVVGVLASGPELGVVDEALAMTAQDGSGETLTVFIEATVRIPAIAIPE